MTIGRPTKYTKEMGEEICARIADGESLRSICKDDHICPKGTIMAWLFKDDEKYKTFHDQYAKARQMQAESMVDECLDIADNGTNDWMTRYNNQGEEYQVQNTEAIQRSKLRLDARKWVAARLLPKKYGDFQRNEISGPDGGEIKTNNKWTVEIVNAETTDPK